MSGAVQIRLTKDAMIQMSRIALDHQTQELQHELTWPTNGLVHKAIRKQLKVAEKALALKREPEWPAMMFISQIEL